MSDAVMHHRGSNQEGEAMSFAIYSPPATRSLDLKVSLIFGVLFPFFLAASLFRRLTALLGASEPAPRSAIREARENTSLAISHALMARAMLQSFARD
jgi:hypothetical protein